MNQIDNYKNKEKNIEYRMKVLSDENSRQTTCNDEPLSMNEIIRPTATHRLKALRILRDIT